jgi:hypothetical protein
MSSISRRSMSRTGSILESYWNPKTECSTPHLGTLNSFDLESTDELGIHGNNSSSKSKLDISSSAAILAPVINTNRHNTMNGLFLINKSFVDYWECLL